MHRGLRHRLTRGHLLIATSTRGLSTAQSANVIETLKSRGLVAQLTNETIGSAPMTVYSGFDPTAPSLHIGNLLPLITLHHFHRSGHKPIALIGGATGFIGDPGGRTTERQLLERETLETNVRGITRQVHRFFETAQAYSDRRVPPAGTSKQDPLVVNNYSWFKDMPVLEFLRFVGKHAKVNTMMARDSVSARLNGAHGISFTEFSYQLLQAYDYYKLSQDHGCNLQIGGSDQWGNIVAGIDLIHRLNPSETEGSPAFGLTIPLLTTPSGDKFGKSAGNAVWLDPDLTSVFDFYQFFIRVSDDMVQKLLSMFTLLPKDAARAVMTEHELDPSKRHAQRTLAREVTELVHGFDAVRQAEAATQALFHTDVSQVKSADVVAALRGGSGRRLAIVQELVGLPVTKLMALHGGAKSRAEANQVVKMGGFYLNGVKITSPSQVLETSDLIDGNMAILRTGADNHLVLVLEGSTP